jgi:hypothetical protein
LIGVIPKKHQIEVVEEFFELFKTPWELYRPGRTYDVIISTAEEIPEEYPRLLLVYGETKKRMDERLGITPNGQHRHAIISHRGMPIPVYGNLLAFESSSKGLCCATVNTEIAGLIISLPGSTVLRFGYDLFDEVQFLLSAGQPPENAGIPTLELHIALLRQWILDAGIPLLEIPATPAGHSFFVCLTHDIDFVGIRNHLFDHSMWGFVYRATFGAVRNYIRGRISWTRLLRSWIAVVSLPFVYAGWVRDFWEPFAWYLKAEDGLPSTYFLIPFGRRPGKNVSGSHASRRAAAYDINEISHWIGILLRRGCELGVHGIDAWHSEQKGRDELSKLAGVTNESSIGIRMHWLLRNANTPSILERAGYAYDSTLGYNETVGYRAGTSQVFRPLDAQTLLELPLHIQDGALFYPSRLNLSEPEAEKRCKLLIDDAGKFGGVLTILWHDRSHAPERFWGDFYVKLLQTLKSHNAWFGTAAQVVDWFQKRREVRFEWFNSSGNALMRLRYDGNEIEPPLRIRVYGTLHRSQIGESARNPRFIDVPWNGKSMHELEIPAAFSTYNHSGVRFSVS